MCSFDVVTNAQEHLNLDTVRKIGLALPGVKECTTWGAPTRQPFQNATFEVFTTLYKPSRTALVPLNTWKTEIPQVKTTGDFFW